MIFYRTLMKKAVKMKSDICSQLISNIIYTNTKSLILNNNRNLNIWTMLLFPLSFHLL